MSLMDEITARGISEVVHFTTNRGLLGALASQSLLSRPLLGSDAYLRHVLQLNAAVRPEESALFDKTEDWIRFVNLSISEINRRFLDVSRRWHTNDYVWWCILSFEIEIMTHDNVWFTTTNNGYEDCLRRRGVEGFEGLFANRVVRKKSNSWSVTRQNRPPCLTTCEQAEVLYPERLSLKHLQKVYVEEDGHHDAVAGWLDQFKYENVEVVIDQRKFEGRQN